jgi:hypothetical protein
VDRKRLRSVLFVVLPIVAVLFLGYAAVNNFLNRFRPGPVTDAAVLSNSAPTRSISDLQADIAKSQAAIPPLEEALAPLDAARKERDAELEKARIPAMTGYHSFFGTDASQRNYFKERDRIAKENEKDSWRYAAASMNLARGQERVTDLQRQLELARASKPQRAWIPFLSHAPDGTALVASYDAEVKALSALTDAVFRFDRMIGGRQFMLSDFLRGKARDRRFPRDNYEKLTAWKAKVDGDKKTFDNYLDACRKRLDQRRRELADLREAMMTPAERQRRAMMQQMMLRAIGNGMANLPDTSDVYKHMGAFGPVNTGVLGNLPQLMMGSPGTAAPTPQAGQLGHYCSYSMGRERVEGSHFVGSPCTVESGGRQWSGTIAQ